ncbi:MAG: hypothetical protein FJY79_07845 [Candidatus Aminicenantes bacterium]|nr:hypothetical protein [Candidatus Aminicenantes bacterium]
MFKKTTALLTMAAFILFSASCTITTWKTREINTTADYPADGRKVLSVVKSSGEAVEFSNSSPGRIAGAAVVGEGVEVVRKRAEIARPVQSIKRRADGTIFQVTDSSGRVHAIEKVLKEEPDKLTVEMVYRTYERVSIPLSDVRLLRYKKTNAVLTFAAVMLTAFAALAIWVSIEESKH